MHVGNVGVGTPTHVDNYRKQTRTERTNKRGPGADKRADLAARGGIPAYGYIYRAAVAPTHGHKRLVFLVKTDAPLQLRNRCGSAMRPTGLGCGSRIERGVVPFRLTGFPPAS